MANNKSNNIVSAKVDVVISNKIILSLFNYVVDNKFNVINLYNSNQHLHHFKISPSMAAKLTNANMVIYSCRNIEPHIYQLSHYQTSSKTQFIELCGLLPKKTIASFSDLPDGHFWTTPPSIELILDPLLEILIKKYPGHRLTLIKNTKKLKDILHELDQEYKTALNNKCTNASFGVHAAYDYLAKFYPNFNYQGEVSHDIEKGFLPQKLKKMLALNKDKGRVCLFVEPSHAEICTKIKERWPTIKVTQLDIDGDLLDNDQDFISYFRTNLQQIQTCLCHA